LGKLKIILEIKENAKGLLLVVTFIVIFAAFFFLVFFKILNLLKDFRLRRSIFAV